LNNLTTQLSGLREFIASQGQATNPAAQAQGAASWIPQSGGLAYTRPGEQQAGIFHGPTPGSIQTGPQNNPTEGAKQSREQADALRKEYTEYMEDIKAGVSPRGGELSKPAENMMAHHISDIDRMRIARGEKKAGYVGSAVDRFFELYPGASRDPREDTSYGFESGTRVNEYSAMSTTPSGMAPPGPTAPGPSGHTSAVADMGDMPGWAQALSRDGISPDQRLGLTIPRLGEFTIQDKLNMAAQWMGRSAMRRQEAGDDGSLTSGMGRAAAGAAYLRDNSASIVAIQREFQRVAQFARGQELGGESLGYSRESATGDIEALGIGFRPGLPGLSAASREGLRQELTQRRVQAAAGVSGEEAQRIRQTVAGLGYSGDENANMQMNLFRPLQQRGIGPETFAPVIDQGLRQGNMSIVSLKDTIIDLADAARNAHMNLDEVAQSTTEYSEQVQALGANYEASLRNATTYVRSGLDPRIVGQAQQNPMVQGIITAQTGIPGQLQGIVGAPGVMQGMSQAIRQGLALGSGFANQPDRTVTSASGQRITVSTGRDAQIAMAAQTTGIPRQIIERYMRNPDFLEAGGTAQTMVGQMQDQIRGATQRSRRITVNESHGRLGAYDPLHQLGGSHEETQGYSKDLTRAQRRALEHGSTSDNVIQYDELEQQMIAMDPTNKDWVSRVKKIGAKGKVEDRVKSAQKLIGEATKATAEPDYMVGLTAEARKVLKIEKPKERDAALPRANAGGAPANSAMQGPNYPGSSGSAMSYGTPGG
jgi:hypothetical protein